MIGERMEIDGRTAGLLRRRNIKLCEEDEHH
jgi:hypothetical protein